MSSIYYHTDAFAPLIYINGKKFRWQDPNGNYWTDTYNGKNYNVVNNPAQGYVEKSEQLVRSTRNANGQVISQKINRRLNKFDSLRWPYLSRTSVHWLKQEIAKFECELTYWDDEVEAWITRRYYWGDFEATPCEWEKVQIGNTGEYFKRPTWYKDVKCNLIDMGYGNVTSYFSSGGSISGGGSDGGGGTSW